MAVRFNYSVSVHGRKGGGTVSHSRRRGGLWRGVVGGVLGLGSAAVLVAVILPLALAVVVGGMLMLAGLAVMTALAGGNRARLSRDAAPPCRSPVATPDGEIIDATFRVLGEGEGDPGAAAGPGSSGDERPTSRDP